MLVVFVVCPPPREVDTGLRGFCLCLFGGDVADRGVPPLPIVVAFDIGEQVAPRSIAIRVLVLTNELGFQSTEEALHRRIVPAISFAAHGGLQDVAVVAGGILAGAGGM